MSALFFVVQLIFICGQKYTKILFGLLWLSGFSVQKAIQKYTNAIDISVLLC